MCIAIVKPEGLEIDRETLEICWNVNPDGAGFAYVKRVNGKDEIITNKFLDFEQFYNAYSVDEKKYKKTPFLIHFRAASVGDVNLRNCHPHIINDGQVFIHNGTIHAMKPSNTKSKDSDTTNFNELVLKGMPFGWEKNMSVNFLLEEYIGSGNKIAILNRDKTFYIINEDKGIWDKGIWWSNEHYTGDYIRGQYGYARKITEVEKERENRQKFEDAYDKWSARNQHYPGFDDEDPSNPGAIFGIKEPATTFTKDQQQFLPHIVNKNDKKKEFNCDWCNCGFNESPEVVTLRGTHETYEVCKACRGELERLGGLIDAD